MPNQVPYYTINIHIKVEFKGKAGSWLVTMTDEKTGIPQTLQGKDENTTERKLELRAFSEALDNLTYRCQITVLDPSKYLADGLKLPSSRHHSHTEWSTIDKHLKKRKHSITTA